MSFFKDQYARDLDNVFFNPDERASEIYWDDGKILAIVSDDAANANDYEGVRILRKLVSIKQDSISVKPVVGDQINLNLDIDKVDYGDFWTVEKVEEPPSRYKITFIRYAS